MECIICHDIGTEPLQDNKDCACKYKIHNSCWLDYIRHVNNVTCLMCRKNHTALNGLSVIIQEPINVPHDIVIVINQPNLVEGRNNSALICPIGVCLSLVILLLVLIWK